MLRTIEVVGELADRRPALASVPCPYGVAFRLWSKLRVSGGDPGERRHEHVPEVDGELDVPSRPESPSRVCASSETVDRACDERPRRGSAWCEGTSRVGTGGVPATSVRGAVAMVVRAPRAGAPPGSVPVLCEFGNYVAVQ
ncbi:hypothetical protein GQ85_08285 [Rhodococcus rhodochrous]|nr:hypothetical protein GQ85_08285 [Rhodococcus rhodochrous]